MTKTLLISAAAIAFFVSPVVAQQQAQTTQSAEHHHLFSGKGIIQGNDVYDCTGKYLGSDPDPKIRMRLLREGDASCW